MVSNIIDGTAIAAQLRVVLQQEASALARQYGRPPGLAVLLVGNDPASTLYIERKRAACAEIGIVSQPFFLPRSITEVAVLEIINTLNHDNTVDGILLQLPLPAHLSTSRLLEAILPSKDVDGLHPYNMGCLAQRRPGLRPCTPLGVMTLLQHIDCDLHQADAVVIGASNIVGRPMALELLLAGATVSVCHRGTVSLKKYIETADVIVSAVGIPGLIQGAWIKPGAVIMDVGITRLPSGALAGDVEFSVAVKRASWITPVPGGVGPMTVAMLLKNTLQAMRLNMA